ncbi:MAG: deaminase [Candidatus Woesearchaeota archaeon]
MALHKYDWSTIPEELWRLFSYDIELSIKIKFMKEAIHEAKKSYKGFSDGAQCGAIIVNNETIIARGHRRVIYPITEGKTNIIHAEQAALSEAGTYAKGSDLYVTLEPCFERGTKDWFETYLPCSTIIPETGVKRVIIGLVDKYTQTYGKGIKHLVESGIKVEFVYCGLEKQLFDLVKNGNFYAPHPSAIFNDTTQFLCGLPIIKGHNL